MKINKFRIRVGTYDVHEAVDERDFRLLNREDVDELFTFSGCVGRVLDLYEKPRRVPTV